MDFVNSFILYGALMLWEGADSGYSAPPAAKEQELELPEKNMA